MYKKLFMSVCMFSMLMAQEPTDRFAAFLPNKYRAETYDMIVKWGKNNQNMLPRNAVIKQVRDMDLSWRQQQWVLTTLDVRGWTLINNLYLGDEREQPQLYAFLKQLAAQYEVPMPVVLIPDLGVANMMTMSYDSHLNVLVVPFGALANKVWDTEGFEAFLAHEFAHIKHGDTRTMKTTQALMIGLRAATAIASFVGYLIYKDRHGNIREPAQAAKEVFKALGVGGLGFLASWPLDVLLTVLVRRHIEKRADRLAVEMGYGSGLRKGLHRMGKQNAKPKPFFTAMQSLGRRFRRFWQAFFPPNEDTMRDALVQGYGYPTHMQRAARVKDIVEDQELSELS